MAILLWLLPPAVLTCMAMAWAAWMGRGRPALHERSEAAQRRSQERFAEAIAREMPRRTGARRPSDPSTGVAIRRNGPGDAPSV